MPFKTLVDQTLDAMEPPKLENLTPRRRQVVELINEGKTIDEIIKACDFKSRTTARGAIREVVLRYPELIRINVVYSKNSDAKAKKAVALFLSGYATREIAKMLEYSSQNAARNAITRYAKKHPELQSQVDNVTLRNKLEKENVN